MWPGLTPPYPELFAWLEGRAEKPVNLDPAPFRPVMLAHAIENTDFAGLDAADSSRNGNGTASASRRCAASTPRPSVARLYSRSGEDITESFPDLLPPSLHLPGPIDGELLVVRDGRVQSFNVLQQRLNRNRLPPS